MTDWAGRMVVVGVIFGLATCATAASEPTAKLASTITYIGEEYRNVDLGATAAELEAVGITVGMRVEFVHCGETRTAPFVTGYADVDKGDWLILIDDGGVRIAISYGHACDVLDCQLGDEVTLSAAGAAP